MEFNVLSGNILTDITDHLPNFIIIDKMSTLNPKTKLYETIQNSVNNHS